MHQCLFFYQKVKKIQLILNKKLLFPNISLDCVPKYNKSLIINTINI